MADGQQTTATKQAPVDIKPLTLAKRMAAIRVEADAIGKEDIKMEKDGKKWTIKGHTVEAVLSEMRPLFAKHGVHFIPQLAVRTQSGNRCDVEVDFEFMDLETAETKIIRWGGSGTDNGDKAFAKAGTNALKEMLKKVFLITDRDDAKEETEAVEHKTDEGISRAEVDKSAEALREANEKRAKLVRAALQKATDADEVKRLEREHSAWIKQLPEVTRAFFSDLIKTRKAFFAPPTPEELARAEGDDETVWEDREDEPEGAK